MAINIHSDHVLRNLRKPGETGYKIPKGGMFEQVSAANLFGEILEWSGYALFAQTLPAVAFSVFTFSNLVPRALEHHRWYRTKFDDYPAERKAVIPFLL
ncbi:5alpha-reductase I [Aphelenchoides avenae]|nr:5alpha-reductase I [Aphelenchus avenae]